jgi:hypothetical protein
MTTHNWRWHNHAGVGGLAPSLARALEIDERLVTARDIGVSACDYPLAHRADIACLGRPSSQFLGEHRIPSCIPGKRRSQLSYVRRRPVLMRPLKRVNRTRVGPKYLPDPLDDPRHKTAANDLAQLLHPACGKQPSHYLGCSGYIHDAPHFQFPPGSPLSAHPRR